MLKWCRRPGALRAPLALVLAGMVLVGTVDWWHADDRDAGISAFHDHGSHQPLLRAVPTDQASPDQHCYLCHWLRTLGNGLQAASAHGAATSESRSIRPVVHPLPSVLAAAFLPARAPPV